MLKIIYWLFLIAGGALLYISASATVPDVQQRSRLWKETAVDTPPSDLFLKTAQVPMFISGAGIGRKLLETLLRLVCFRELTFT